jgi:hypothetical protein
MPGERLNFMAGTFSLSPQNVGQVTTEVVEFSEELSTISFSADSSLPREKFVDVLNAVRIRYASGGQDDDFLETVSATDQTTNLESVRTYQDTSERGLVGATEGIRSFDMNYSHLVIGRLPTTLRGDLETYNDFGADKFEFSGIDVVPFSVNDDGTPSELAPLIVTFNATAEDPGAEYDSMNLLAGAFARMMSSQFPNSGGDQNLLKIMVEQESYENLMRIAIGGFITQTGEVTSIQNYLHSNEVSKGFGMSLVDLQNRVFDTNTPSSRSLGHEIMLALYSKCPATLGNDDDPSSRNVAYKGEDNSIARRPYKIIPLEGTDSDGLALEYAENLINTATGNKIDINLQFVVRTKLTMVLRDSTQLTTLNPATGQPGFCEFLLNFLFDG